MSRESVTTSPLLWIILLAVLIEPLALALILQNEDPGLPPPAADPALAEAVADLSREVERLGKIAPSVTQGATAPPPADARPAAPAPAGEARPIPSPEPGVRVEPDAKRRFPRKQANIDAWVQHERERSERGEDDEPMLFFHRTTSEILAEFGIPDLASESEAGVRWTYEGSEDRGMFLLDFHDGRVYRTWFN